MGSCETKFPTKKDQPAWQLNQCEETCKDGRFYDSQELCDPKTKACFTFCHKNCPGIEVKGIGTIYAQYRYANGKNKGPYQNYEKINFETKMIKKKFKGYKVDSKFKIGKPGLLLSKEYKQA